jgi:hypothetical protein
MRPDAHEVGARVARLASSEPGRFWVRRYFAAWPAAPGPWLDLARGRLGDESGPATDIPSDACVTPSPEPVYLPPVPLTLEGPRNALAGRLAEAGSPVVVQVVAGTGLAPAPSPGVEVVVDVLSTLVSGRSDEALASAPPQSVALWPLVAGLSDNEKTCRGGCEALAAAGVRCVQPVAPELEARERQRLLDASPDAAAAFERVFHGERPSEQAFARIAAEFGLATVYRRRADSEGRAARNFAAAEMLSLAGDVWLRLGRSEALAQELFRASRAAEEAAFDLRATVLEGNLDVIPWLSSSASELLEEWSRDRSTTLDSWIAAWESGEEPKGGGSR